MAKTKPEPKAKAEAKAKAEPSTRAKRAAPDVAPPESVESGGSGSALSIGPTLRARRKRLGMTLAQLAEQSGLSTPFISQVERGQAAPSIVSLLALSKGLGVEVSYFLSVPKPSQIVRRASKREMIDAGLSARYVRLSGKHEERQLEALLIEVPAGNVTPTATRDGEGFWYVLSGVLEMTVGDERFSLSEGDSAHFDQRHPYSMKNPGKDLLRMLWVGTPAIF